MQLAVAEALYPLLHKLMTLKSDAQTAPAVEANILLLETLAIRFQTEEDFNFLKSVNIFEWLAPLLFSEKYDNVEKSEEEKAKDKAEKEGKEKAEQEAKEREEKEKREQDSKAKEEEREKEKEAEGEGSSAPTGGDSAAEGSEGSEGRNRSKLSDSDFARQLQAQFDTEEGDGNGEGESEGNDASVSPRRMHSQKSPLSLSDRKSVV